jgi:hypothetical protein
VSDDTDDGMDELAQMIFGFQCCSAAQEERDSHLADKTDFAKQKKLRSSRRSKRELKSTFAGHTSDSGLPASHGNNEQEPISRTYAPLSCKSLRPPSASIAADNALVGESRCPASGSLNSRSAFAPTPPPESSHSPTRFHALPRVIPTTPQRDGELSRWHDILDLGTESRR